MLINIYYYYHHKYLKQLSKFFRDSLIYHSKAWSLYIYISGGPLSALTWVYKLGLFYASYDDFHPDILARMYT